MPRPGSRVAGHRRRTAWMVLLCIWHASETERLVCEVLDRIGQDGCVGGCGSSAYGKNSRGCGDPQSPSRGSLEQPRWSDRGTVAVTTGPDRHRCVHWRGAVKWDSAAAIGMRGASVRSEDCEHCLLSSQFPGGGRGRQGLHQLVETRIE